MTQEISGYIERITFQSEETGFVVAKMMPDSGGALICITGMMPSIEEGQSLICTGTFSHHPKHGSQFSVEALRFIAPRHVRAIEKYLASGLVKGVGPTYAKKIVKVFGEKTLEVIDERPGSLMRVPGIGKKRLTAIRSGWQQHKGVRDVMVFLGDHGVSVTFATKILKAYGSEAISRIEENPYALAKHIAGMGFKKADKIAESLGVGRASEKRLKAGIEHTLQELTSQGHTCYPREELIALSFDVLKCDEVEEKGLEEVAKALQTLIQEKSLLEKEIEGVFRIFLPRLDTFEKAIADQVALLKQSPRKVRSFDPVKAIEWLEQKLPFKLEKVQKEALIQTFSNKVHVITGGPGTGKSTLIKGILTVFSRLTPRVLLAAPTGKAAKRMSQITRRKAFTLHALLEYDFKMGGFKKNADKPLQADLIIIDEASMIDTALMHHFLQAVPLSAKLILVGDTDQLPSIGPGNVLKDLIESRCVEVTQLTKIFRQAWSSKIIKSAYQINQGQFFSFDSQPEDDLFFIEREEPESVKSEIIDLVKRRLPNKYGFDPIQDIQVLTPMRKGAIGADQLNCDLQSALNPNKEPLWSLGRKLQLQDKVMQIRNNYDKNVFNGDVGIITSIDNLAKELVIDFEGKEVAYGFSELDEISLCYAVSIHKYQGSECPCVVIPVHTAHFKLLNRNLLYTGITRARKLVVLVGTKKALAIAIHNNEVKMRYTGLKSRFGSKDLLLSAQGV